MRLAFRSIASYADQPQNNYLLLRFLAALLVIYGHSYAIVHLRWHIDLLQRALRFTFAGTVGVDIFFVISGFLVTGSYLVRRDWFDFMKSRCLRIFPGLIVCLLAMTFLLGPVVTSLPAVQYLTDPQLYTGLLRNFTLVDLHLRLPGVFDDLPIDSVNGSLWTLPAEFMLYVFLGIFGAAGILFSRKGYLPFILLMCALALGMGLEVNYVHNKVRYIPLFFLFATGSVIRVYSDRIPLSSWILGVASVVMVLAVYYHFAYAEYVFIAWLVYATFWFAYVPNLHFFNRAGDYSYGLYIYAFPIGQALRQYIPDIQPMPLFGLTSLLTLVCAMLSWHFVEHPALRLKKVKFRELIRRRVAAGS